MNSKNDPIHKRLAEFVQDKITGGTFIGISNEKEVFLSFEGLTLEDESAAKTTVKGYFGDEITTIATIVSVSMEEVTHMVDGLNNVLKDLEEEKESPITGHACRLGPRCDLWHRTDNVSITCSSYAIEPKKDLLNIGNF